MGEGVGEGRGILTNDAPYRQHQRDCSIKVGSDECHFNASLTVRGKITMTMSINHNFLRRKEICKLAIKQAINQSRQPHEASTQITSFTGSFFWGTKNVFPTHDILL